MLPPACFDNCESHWGKSRAQSHDLALLTSGKSALFPANQERDFTLGRMRFVMRQ
jgi:hypothetical protein